MFGNGGFGMMQDWGWAVALFGMMVGMMALFFWFGRSSSTSDSSWMF